MTDSLSQDLHHQTVARIVERFNLQEVAGADGGAYLELHSKAPMVSGSLGQVRVYRGAPLFQLVTCSIVVPPIGLDSHMLFAFVPADGAIPHFTVDSVRNGDAYAFHLDLIPRLDLATHLTYMDETFAPLTPIFKQHRELEGLAPAQLDPRQYAVMSPWMLVNRCSEAAFIATFASVNAYLDHWFALVENGVSSAALEGAGAAQLAERDTRHKAIIFNPEVDKVWKQIEPLLGADTVQQIIGLLRATAH